MIGPLTLLTTEPLLLLVQVAALLAGMILKGVVQARLAAYWGDERGVQAGFGWPEPAVHLDLWRLALHLLIGVALPRPVPLALRGSKAAAALLSGPLMLIAFALVLLALQRAQQQLLPATADVIGTGLGRAAYGLCLHALFNLLPLPGLDLGRMLAHVVHLPRLPRPLRGTLLPALAWTALFLTGTLQQATAPLWAGLQNVIALLP
jgi:Zn-dependent protease